MQCSSRAHRYRCSLRGRTRAFERVAPDACDRDRVDGGDESPARNARGPACPRARRQRSRRSARCCRGPDGRRAHGQRDRRRRVRARLGRRRALRAQRVGPFPRRSRRPHDGGRRRARAPSPCRVPCACGTTLRPGSAGSGSIRRSALLPSLRKPASPAARASPTSGRRHELAPWPAPRLGERYALPDLGRHASPDRGERAGGPVRRGGRVGDRGGVLALARPISSPIVRSGWSLSAGRTAASRSASCRRTARGPQRCSRSHCTRASSPESTRRSRR